MMTNPFVNHFLTFTRPVAPNKIESNGKTEPKWAVDGLGKSCASRARCVIVMTTMMIAFCSSPVLALNAVTPSHTPKLGFLSFDLDDTLFPTSEVVNEANDVMILKMHEYGFATTVTDFLATTRRVRQTLTAPITYSDLRKRAIGEEMKRIAAAHPDAGVIIPPEWVDDCFHVWLTERHAAAERYLFEDVISMLNEIRSAHPQACIGAITNGRGNPLDMTETLEPFFDFCVSGEDENVFPERKPNAGIYEKSLEYYRHQCPEHANDQDNTYVWCHVGDCLANDVGASASCGAFAVWYNPEGESTNDQEGKGPVDQKAQPQWSTATQKDLNQRAILENEGRQKVGAEISRLADLADTIQSYLNVLEETNKESVVGAFGSKRESD